MMVVSTDTAKHHPVSFLEFFFFLVHDTHTHTVLSRRQDTNRREFKLHVYMGEFVVKCVGGVKNFGQAPPACLLFEEISRYPCCCLGRTCFGLEMLVCYEDCLWLFPFSISLCVFPSGLFLRNFSILEGRYSVLKAPVVIGKTLSAESGDTIQKPMTVTSVLWQLSVGGCVCQVPCFETLFRRI